MYEPQGRFVPLTTGKPDSNERRLSKNAFGSVNRANFRAAFSPKYAFRPSKLSHGGLNKGPGQIVFSKALYSDDSLSEFRAAIAALGPEFASDSKSATK